MTTFLEATRISATDSHTYAVDLSEDWCIGSVPNGGYVASCILAAVRQHFTTTLGASPLQPDCIIMHLEFPQRTSAGRAEVHVTDIKRGRQTSTVQIALRQAGRTPVVGFLTHADISTETGISLPTDWRISPAPPAVADFGALAAGRDPHWMRVPAPNAKFRKASNRVELYCPRTFKARRATVDHWIRLSGEGQRFTDTALGFVSDVSLQVVETYVGDEEAARYAGVASAKELTGNWYPTLALNLDIKRQLPPQGVEWLNLRVSAKEIRNGRLDLEVAILDQEANLIALSHHVCMVLAASRNLASRGKDKNGSSSTKL